MCALVDVIVIN